MRKFGFALSLSTNRQLSIGDFNDINNYITISRIFKLLASSMSIYLIGEFNKLIDARVLGDSSMTFILFSNNS